MRCAVQKRCNAHACMMACARPSSVHAFPLLPSLAFRVAGLPCGHQPGHGTLVVPWASIRRCGRGPFPFPIKVLAEGLGVGRRTMVVSANIAPAVWRKLWVKGSQAGISGNRGFLATLRWELGPGQVCASVLAGEA